MFSVTFFAFPSQNRLGGKILLFQNNLPSVGVGRLRLRGEDPKLYGSEREHTVRVTEDPFYKTMAADFSRVQVSVNVFAFSAHYSDLASIGGASFPSSLTLVFVRFPSISIIHSTGYLWGCFQGLWLDTQVVNCTTTRDLKLPEMERSSALS